LVSVIGFRRMYMLTQRHVKCQSHSKQADEESGSADVPVGIRGRGFIENIFRDGFIFVNIFGDGVIFVLGTESFL